MNNKYLQISEWKIIEKDFNPKNNRASESLFSIGNGKMGQRANFEEYYSGDTLQGNYIAGIYYPDKTRVGWWKNGYPEYFAKVLNSFNWIGIDVKIEGELLDLAKCKVSDFCRVLDMKEGYLQRSFTIETNTGKKLKIEAQRFLSMKDDEIGAVKYTIIPLNFTAKAEVTLYLDIDVMNEDSNYGEKFWEEINKNNNDREAFITARTKKTEFYATAAMGFEITQNSSPIQKQTQKTEREKYIAQTVEVDLKIEEETTVYKYVSIISSLYYSQTELSAKAIDNVRKAQEKSYNALLQEHTQIWAEIWQKSDITIEGDTSAQQAIRFNIFQLNQTYTGKDPRLNIGPKGFTGEKYGGSTYWDTEAYCLPFYLNTADISVARNLLLYRYKHLEKAIENGKKLGFYNGAALYPMVTMNGEECHNEWEITFEEIHRNGAIAYAIYNYVNHTGDKDYLTDYGLEVLIAISRFWKQRITFSQAKNKYVMLGVTGPNEYENNVDNNWYTNTIAIWTMQYTLQVVKQVKEKALEKYKHLEQKLNFKEQEETTHWQDIIDNMYYPYDEKNKIFLQQDGFENKEQITIKDLDPKQCPINQHWSWDRILRSPFIKQADVLQGIYFFEDRFDIETIERHFDFYEPFTVHESSLSPCIHSILASKIGNIDKAYELYLRTARLDLDDYNNEVAEGCHTTSMAGTWLSIVEGFAGLRVRNNILKLNPQIPKQWKSYSFNIIFRNVNFTIKVEQGKVQVLKDTNEAVTIMIFEKEFIVEKKLEIDCE